MSQIREVKKMCETVVHKEDKEKKKKINGIRGGEND